MPKQCDPNLCQTTGTWEGYAHTRHFKQTEVFELTGTINISGTGEGAQLGLGLEPGSLG